MTASASAPLRLLLLILLVGSVYRALALHWAGLNLYVDEAQYWTWAKSLAWGYYSKPPVIAAIIAFTTALFGDGELAIKSGALLLYPLTTLLVYALALRLYDRRVAFWSALTFFTLPGVAFSSVIISTDVALFTSWTAACYGLLRALESNQWRWWLLVGLA
ncbi:MAG: glycosyltransferase family 39 protein, partial [Nevskiaceae bacterium]